MKSFVSIIAILIPALLQTVTASDFSGQYLIQSERGIIILNLQPRENGSYSGTLSGNGNVFQLTGIVENGLLTGSVGSEQDRIIFQAELNGDYLTLTMVEVDQQYNPKPETAQTFIFQRKIEEEPVPADSVKTAGEIIINKQVLTNVQIAEIEKTYGVRPKAGNYWYDSRSGLYGVMGYPAFGFMYAGHDFGKLDRDASNGNTGVLVNGRELPQTEWAVWSSVLGYWIQPGSYWFDDKGNAGYEGSPVVVVNLYVAAQQNASQGGSGGGDNFWTTRFSAGNYDSGNTRGYVSVPGYGPVGYGF